MVSIKRYSNSNKEIITGNVITTTVTGAVTGVGRRDTDDVGYLIGGEETVSLTNAIKERRNRLVMKVHSTSMLMGHRFLPCTTENSELQLRLDRKSLVTTGKEP